MKKNVEFIFPYGAEIYNEGQINRIGLEIIYIIETSEIEYNTAALNMMFNKIDQKCKNSHVWTLYGSIDNSNWIPLQVASKREKNVISEIKSDFLCMTSYDKERDLKDWNSYFYTSVMKVKYGFDVKCQKYQKMREMCKYLAVAILSDEESLAELDNEIISKYQKKECDIALKVKPLFWNPAGREFTYINSIKE